MERYEETFKAFENADLVARIGMLKAIAEKVAAEYDGTVDIPDDDLYVTIHSSSYDCEEKPSQRWRPMMLKGITYGDDGRINFRIKTDEPVKDPDKSLSGKTLSGESLSDIWQYLYWRDAQKPFEKALKNTSQKR